MNRVQSVDVSRGIAISVIVLVHTSPFSWQYLYELDGHYWWLRVIINQFARFSAPLFFALSGYFWARKAANDNDPISPSLVMAKRLALVFAVWCVIYLLPYNFAAFHKHGVLGPIEMASRHAGDLMQHPLRTLVQGTKYHLWFLVALLFSLGITAFFVHKRWIVSLLVLSVILYIVGVLGGAYARTPIGIQMSFHTRNGPFFGTIFFVCGYFMFRLKAQRKWMIYGIVMFFAGWTVHFSELVILLKVFHSGPGHSYVMGTLFMGIGAAMIALSDHPILRNRTLASIGQMSMGIYAVHVIFVDVLEPLGGQNSLLWGLGRATLVLALSVLMTKLLYRYRITRKIVA